MHNAYMFVMKKSISLFITEYTVYEKGLRDLMQQIMNNANMSNLANCSE